MPDYIGLYYPHIHFPHDAWIKLAALYWDKLGRIVPPDHKPDDPDTVQRLEGELGFIENFSPHILDAQEVGFLFYEMICQYGKQLIHQYTALSQDSELEYVYSDTKMSSALAHSL